MPVVKGKVLGLGLLNGRATTGTSDAHPGDIQKSKFSCHLGRGQQGNVKHAVGAEEREGMKVAGFSLFQNGLIAYGQLMI